MMGRGRRIRAKRDLHFLNKDGMVACNPRDREAALRAEIEGMATENRKDVTCKKCRVAMRRA
jgi:hypothetical protein